MGERGDGTGLALEARERIGRIGNGGGQNLDCDLTVEAGVARTEDLAHATGAERRDDLVRAQTLADVQARHEACCSNAAHAITMRESG